MTAEEKTLYKNEVKKDLYKSKAMAKFSHYVGGTLYYIVEVIDGIYQFPINTIDSGRLEDLYGKEIFIYDYTVGEYEKFEAMLSKKVKNDGDDSDYEEIEFKNLSVDLGTTPFNAEIKGSELNRYILKAIDSDEFIKVG